MADFLLSVLANLLGTVSGGVALAYVVDRWLKGRWRAREEEAAALQEAVKAKADALASQIEGITSPEQAQEMASTIRESIEQAIPEPQKTAPGLGSWFDRVPFPPYEPSEELLALIANMEGKRYESASRPIKFPKKPRLEPQSSTDSD